MALGGRRLVLLGGEPLLHPDWDAVAACGLDRGLQVAMVTNGIAVSRAVARRVAELGVSHVGVSLDGASDEIHDGLRGCGGARRKTWRAIERLVAAGVPVTVITTVGRRNLEELEALRDQLLAAGPGLVWQLQPTNGVGERFPKSLMPRPADLLEVARFIERTRAAIDADELAVAAGHGIGHHARTVSDYGTLGEWTGCPGGRFSLGICSDGSVKGCLSQSDREVVGSIRQTPLRELWRAPGPFAAARGRTRLALEGGCAACPHGDTCRAGCPVFARTATGDVRDNPFCLRQAEEAEAGFSA